MYPIGMIRMLILSMEQMVHGFHRYIRKILILYDYIYFPLMSVGHSMRNMNNHHQY